MTPLPRLRHAWLRGALIDRGKLQRDLAKAWDVDEAVVSRFIRTGEPEPGFERIKILAKLLGMEYSHLLMRLGDAPLPPNAVVETIKAPPRARETLRRTVDGDTSTNVLEELHRALARAKAALPGWKIELIIEPNGT